MALILPMAGLANVLAAATEELPRLNLALAKVVDRAQALSPLRTLIVACNGDILIDKGFRGHSTNTPTNIKSASKAIISALVGIAIDKRLLDGRTRRSPPASHQPPAG
jgi:CubicO group peptidase (beta-lactamase class C family)